MLGAVLSCFGPPAVAMVEEDASRWCNLEW